MFCVKLFGCKYSSFLAHKKLLFYVVNSLKKRKSQKFAGEKIGQIAIFV
tara:strand:+ start:1159 stop:1305 length:147 start_codon:yes stop_codon:yes gene_type:complete